MPMLTAGETRVRVLSGKGIGAPALKRDQRRRVTLLMPEGCEADAAAFLEGWREAERLPFPEPLTETVMTSAMPVDRFAAALGISPPTLYWDERKGLWGWLNHDKGVIGLNRTLLRLPPCCAEAVLAHECCHLLYKDHSPAFWALLRELMPGWAWREGLMRGLYQRIRRQNGHAALLEL